MPDTTDDLTSAEQRVRHWIANGARPECIELRRAFDAYVAAVHETVNAKAEPTEGARQRREHGRVSGRRFWITGCGCVQCRANRRETP